LIDMDGATHEGSEAIKKLWWAGTMKKRTIEITNIQLEGDKVLYEMTWYCSDGQVVGKDKWEAVIENGKIKSATCVDTLAYKGPLFY